jgi:hypothetical protein
MTIQEHRLAWRWTDPKYAEFPPDILAQIHPLEPEAAALVHDRWSRCFRKRELISEQFLFRETCNTEGNLNDGRFGSGHFIKRKSHCLAPQPRTEYRFACYHLMATGLRGPHSMGNFHAPVG